MNPVLEQVFVCLHCRKMAPLQELACVGFDDQKALLDPYASSVFFPPSFAREADGFRFSPQTCELAFLLRGTPENDSNLVVLI